MLRQLESLCNTYSIDQVLPPQIKVMHPTVLVNRALESSLEVTFKKNVDITFFHRVGKLHSEKKSFANS